MEKEILRLNQLEAKDGVLKLQHENIEQTKLIYPHRVAIAGTISAPANFIAKRKDQDPELRSNVQYSYQGRYIKLCTNETNEDNEAHTEGYNINGALTENPQIAALQINTNTTFTISNLTKHLRMKRPFFADNDQYERLIQKLQNFSAKVNADINQINDRKGNIEDSYKVTLNSNHENQFHVFMPVFIGQEPRKFNIEIACEARDRQVIFWLESTELLILLEKDTKGIIDAELKRFPEGFVFIEQ
jgi:hypothetical protein